MLCLRNPKDTAVSYYNHMKGLNIYEYNGKWEDWFPVYTQGKRKWIISGKVVTEVIPYAFVGTIIMRKACMKDF